MAATRARVSRRSALAGGFGAADHRRHVHTYAHVIGRAIVHLGHHRHGADDLVMTVTTVDRPDGATCH